MIIIDGKLCSLKFKYSGNYDRQDNNLHLHLVKCMYVKINIIGYKKTSKLNSCQKVSCKTCETIHEITWLKKIIRAKFAYKFELNIHLPS